MSYIPMIYLENVSDLHLDMSKISFINKFPDKDEWRLEMIVDGQIIHLVSKNEKKINRYYNYISDIVKIRCIHHIDVLRDLTLK